MDSDIKTKVSSSRIFKKQFERVPRYIQNKVLTWIYLVEVSGLREVSKSKGLHDEPLSGKRLGQRSVRMNRSYRLIYRVIDEVVHIELLEIRNHEY